MNYTELIDTFGNRIGIDGLAFSRQGSCSVSFHDDELIFELNGNRLFVISDIDIAEDESEALHRVIILDIRPVFPALDLTAELVATL